MDNVLQSEIRMQIARLMRLEDTTNGLKVIVLWKGLEKSEDSSEPLKNVYEDVPQMVNRLLKRKSMPAHFVAKSRAALAS